MKKDNEFIGTILLFAIVILYIIVPIIGFGVYSRDKNIEEIEKSKKEIKKIELWYSGVGKDTIELVLPIETATYRLDSYDNGQPYFRICENSGFNCENYDNVVNYKILK